MGRKNRNAKPRPRHPHIKPNTHFCYSTDELYTDPVIVRYMGRQDGDLLQCWHPAGYIVWAHVTHLWRGSLASQNTTHLTAVAA